MTRECHLQAKTNVHVAAGLLPSEIPASCQVVDAASAPKHKEVWATQNGDAASDGWAMKADGPKSASTLISSMPFNPLRSLQHQRLMICMHCQFTRDTAASSPDCCSTPDCCGGCPSGAGVCRGSAKKDDSRTPAFHSMSSCHSASSLSAGRKGITSAGAM